MRAARIALNLAALPMTAAVYAFISKAGSAELVLGLLLLTVWLLGLSIQSHLNWHHQQEKGR